MLHRISTEVHGPLGPAMARAVEACVHCGFCLAACPTYRELGQEMDTPRGRIVLMKEVLEGQLPWTHAQPHVDRCLGCLACEPACPSGVPYRDLITPFRATASPHFRRGLAEKIRRWFVSQTLPYPGRFRIALRLGLLARRLGTLLPRGAGVMLDLLPAKVPDRHVLPERIPAQGQVRARVALLAGCAQQVLDPDINAAAAEVLARNGVEVWIPRGQGCCGGLDWHTGNLERSRAHARRNLAAFPTEVDAIVTTAAGCGSALHEYGLILRGTPEQARAEAFVSRVKDVSAFLSELGLREPPPPSTRPNPLRAAYHDACHLAHAQGVRREPRELLRTIAGIDWVEIPDGHLCCGSAGSYNLDQPDIAASLGRQKVQAIVGTGAAMVVTGNIGCMTQLQSHLARQGSPVTVRHTMQVLRDAYRGTL